MNDATVTSTEFSMTLDKATLTYRLFHTTAPAAYDYSGVLELTDDDAGGRYILVPVETIPYQQGRNSSGLYPLTPDDTFEPHAIRDIFYAAIAKRFRASGRND